MNIYTLTSKNNIMSKAKNNIPRAAIHVGAPAKSFSAAEGYEPERRGWDENTCRLKNSSEEPGHKQPLRLLTQSSQL